MSKLSIALAMLALLAVDNANAGDATTKECGIYSPCGADLTSHSVVIRSTMPRDIDLSPYAEISERSCFEPGAELPAYFAAAADGHHVLTDQSPDYDTLVWNEPSPYPDKAKTVICVRRAWFDVQE
jgi:hypothetical protein